MSQPLSQQQHDTVKQVLDFIEKLLTCLENTHDHGSDPVRRQEIRLIINELNNMLQTGKIDVEVAPVSEKARTDSNGIHLNELSTFSMPGDLLLNDCREGYFNSLWTLIEILFHEYAHYRHDTGIVGRVVRRIPDTFLGGLALMLGSLFGHTKRTWLWHEMRAYRFCYNILSTLNHYLFMVCLNDPQCIPCCRQHQQFSEEAKRRQDPNSTYGN